jgi:hypothetical protein
MALEEFTQIETVVILLHTPLGAGFRRAYNHL